MPGFDYVRRQHFHRVEKQQAALQRKHRPASNPVCVSGAARRHHRAEDYHQGRYLRQHYGSPRSSQ